MIVGIDCPRCGRVSFSELQKERCLPHPILKALVQYPRRSDPNNFSVGELCNDLGYAYADRTTESYATLENLFAIQRGRSFHKDLLDKFPFKEVEGSMNFDVSGIPMVVHGKLDGYEPSDGVITELKTVRDVRRITQVRMKDELQAQCYGTLFKTSLVRVSGLRLMYVDMSGWKIFSLPLSDKTEFIKSRASTLYEALRMRSPPRDVIFSSAFSSARVRVDG
jgi:hypothetical protein